MRKRPRRKRPKRSSRGQERQERQQLSRQVRELYQPGATESGTDTEWQAELQQQVEPRQPKRRPSRRDVTLGSRPTEVPWHDETTSEPQQIGRVVAISSGACQVSSDGREVDCILPSELARDQQAAVAIGDEVAFAAHGECAHRLVRVLPRRATLSRPDPRNPRRQRVIAANIDVAVHVASVVEPPLRPALVDRYLIAIERGGAEAVICVNKIDLLTDGARRRELDRLDAYERTGTLILPCSATTGEGLDHLRSRLRGRTAVFVGHSGVGKSSLLNALSPVAAALTGRVTVSSGKGRHTTTRSNLYQLGEGIEVIDTPGIREFGLWQLSADELRAYFPELDRVARHCRFADCGHSHEPDCAVRAASEAGELPASRYRTYLRILESLQADEAGRR
ncbi:MAG: ribosome small subunit-dependent GTPase A [Acidobacteriota bacterium]